MIVMVQTVNIDFFRTLKINQRLATIQGIFIQEKQLNLKNSMSFVAIYFSLVPFPYSHVCGSLENQQGFHVETMMKISDLQANKKVRIRMELF